MRPRRHRSGQVFWKHEDVRHVDGGWACRGPGCAARAQAPWRFYCSAPCRRTFLDSVPPFWPELAREVRRRDGNACVLCGAKASRTTRLEVDHIKPVALYPELEFEHTNLRTLCQPCHSKHGARPQSKRWARLHGPRPERQLQLYDGGGI